MSNGQHSHEDDHLIATIGAAYVPRRLEPSRRVALEQQLWARIEKRRRSVGFRPLAAAVTFAAAVLWFAPMWQGTIVETPNDTLDTLIVAAVDVDPWEYDLLYPDDTATTALQVAADDEPLPDDYRAIEALLSDG